MLPGPAMDAFTIAMLGQLPPPGFAPPAGPRAAVDGAGATLAAGSVQLPELRELYDASVDAYYARPAATRGMRPSFPAPGFHPLPTARASYGHAAPVSNGGGAFNAGPMVLPLPHEIYGAGRGVNAYVRPGSIDMPVNVRLPSPGFPSRPARGAPVYDGATGFTGSVVLPQLHELYDAGKDAYVRTGVDVLASLPPAPGFPALPARADAKNAATSTRPKEQGLPFDEPYEQDIDDYVRAMEKEAKQRPSPDYMWATQTELNQSMRVMVISWLYSVARECELAPGTLHRAVSYIDRFMSRKQVRRWDLQLLGAAAIFLAAKYEDSYTTCSLGAERLAALTDHSYTKHEVLAMEVDVLKTLGHEVSGPTSHTFLERFSSKHDGGGDGAQFRSWACQLAELVLLDYRSIQFLPSVVAASAVFVARLMLNPLDPPWNKGLRELTGYMPPDLLGCVAVMYEMDVDWSLPHLSTGEMKKRYMKIRLWLPDTKAIPVLYSDDPSEKPI